MAIVRIVYVRFCCHSTTPFANPESTSLYDADDIHCVPYTKKTYASKSKTTKENVKNSKSSIFSISYLAVQKRRLVKLYKEEFHNL